MTSIRPYHYISFALLFIVNHFFQIVSPGPGVSVWHWLGNTVLAIAICAGVSYGIFLTFCIWFSRYKSAVLTVCITLPFFFFQDAFMLAEKLVIAGARARYVLPVIFLLVVFLIFRVVRTKRNLVHLNQYLDVVSVALLAYTTIMLAINFKLPQSWSSKLPDAEIHCNECPDVYFFLLDSYTSNQSLKNYFGYDNSEFVNDLQSIGFQVKQEATTRHKHTAYSLASTLNLDSLPGLENHTDLAPLLNSNAVVNAFTKKGYDFNNFSIFEVGDVAPYYSMAVTAPGKVLNGIMASSILNIAVSDVLLKVKLFDIHEDIAVQTIRVSARSSSMPNFTYAHFLSPHPPFVMNDRGEKIPFFKQPRNIANADAYVEQVKGLNKKLLSLFNEIIANKPDAVIIALGDHGYRYLTDEKISEKEAHTVFLAYRGKESIHDLQESNKVFQIVLKELSEEH